MSVTSLVGDHEAGDYDISIPLAISQPIEKMLDQTKESSTAYGTYRDRLLNLWSRIVKKEAGSESFPWWNMPPSSGTTTYECDDNLGTPGAADCHALEFSELGRPSDTVTVGPNTPKLLSSSKSPKRAVRL